MKSSSTRPWFYIVINILVSAATTLVVLLIWDLAHPAPKVTPVPTPAEAPVPTQTLASQTQAPTVALMDDNIQITIPTVVGAGNLDMEYIEIFNQGEGAVDLTGWQLMDLNGHLFDFPTMILDSGGTLTVYSKAGQNTVIELYWQANAPIWQSGETVQLLDRNGNLAASYSIP